MRSAQRTKNEEFDRSALPHLNDLFRTARRLLGDPSRAEDVVQEVYLQAWKSFHQFEAGTNCRAWLFAILVNKVHHYRRKWLNLKFFDDDLESASATEAALAYAPPAPDQLTDRQVLAALDRVPSDFRAVVLLADVEEFSYKEIAGILKIPMGTVMSRLSRGRKLLREQLQEVAESYGIRKARPEAHGT